MLEIVRVDDVLADWLPDYRCCSGEYLQKNEPFVYEENKLVLLANCAFKIKCDHYTVLVKNKEAFVFDPMAVMDKPGGFEVGHDYFVYLSIKGEEPLLTVSENGTFPLGAEADQCLKIGGFHYGAIRKVSSDGLWIPIDSNGIKFGNTGIIWQQNTTIGIVPNSVWDMKNRPRTLFGGLVKVGNIWASIYQASKRCEFAFMKGENLTHVSAGRLQSRYGQLPVSGIDGLCQYNFAELAGKAGMRLMTYAEWLEAAFGAPQGEENSNRYGWCDVTNKIRCRTGCSVNPENGRYDPEKGEKPFAISAYNVVDTTGNVWEWMGEYTNRHDAGSGNWTYYDQLGEGMGQIYGWKTDSFSAFAVGGHWHRGAYCGSRAINPDDQPWKVNVHIGTRLACDAL